MATTERDPTDICEWGATTPTATVAAVLYLVVVVAGRAFMQSRQSLKENRLFKLLLTTHNAALCVYSGIIFVCTLGLLLTGQIIPFDKLLSRELVCDPERLYFQGASAWILVTFEYSKMYEYVDTLFLVLAKSRLRFLHVYHHIVTLILSAILLNGRLPVGWYSVVTNSFVHMLMYYYYTVASLGGTVWWKKHLTQMQIVQFLICLTLQAYGFSLHLTDGCAGDSSALNWPYAASFLCYASFAVLFAKLFIDTYCTGKPRAGRLVPETHATKKKE
eukprot:TRINITY_DN6912_c0_g1_i1.p1 TRINITY_DN6912_c0_g1~~TRINITY_DN6912_c0_g1_i1.p1  ORF type:complete len:294 (-),score=67.02 TRINITY_DN6912_c0_g1_i1:117-941(-)